MKNTEYAELFLDYDAVLMACGKCFTTLQKKELYWNQFKTG